MHGDRSTGNINPLINTNNGSNSVPNSHYHHNNQNSNCYLNCAAPKSVLTNNCQLIRQIRSDYPPYPTDVGNYHAQQMHPKMSLVQPSNRLNPLEVNVVDQRQPTASSKIKGSKHPSILKIYKSCPVSPVHEDIDRSIVDRNCSPFENSSTPNDRDQFEQGSNKRHSIFSDDAKTILDMIHSNTEKMIAEITQKYGDLNVGEHNQMPKNNANGDNNDNEEDGTFSSDSLEDCSLDLEWNSQCQTNKRVKKSICKKKHRKNESLPLVRPTRSISEYFTYDTHYGSNPHRNVSLSDILNEDAEKQTQDYAFLNSQRHSSASFFLVPERKSQESLISDDMSGCDGVSYCNSMESILSDESECKSAPLEALFMKTKRDMRFYNAYDSTNVRINAQCTTSKSYGSSPNNGLSGGFDYYMDQNYSYGFQGDDYNIDNYDYDSLMNSNPSARASNRCSPLPPPPPEFQNITKSSIIPNACTFPSLSTICHSQNKNDDFIPRFGSKNDQYTAQNKSLSKDFAVERQMNNSNPLYTCDDDDFFQRKPVNIKPAIPAKPNKLLPLPNDSNKSIASSTSNEQTIVHCSVKKSCSFEIEMFHNRGKALQKSAAKKYEQNLQKFENDRIRNRKTNEQFGGTMEMNYVPHKPPVANRRSASMKTKCSTRHKESQSKMVPNEKLSHKCHNNNRDDFHDERSIEIYVAEKGVCENDNMDSLELYAKPNLYKENSIDSLDELSPKKRKSQKTSKTIDAQIRCQSAQSMITADFLSRNEFEQFRNIEKKIDVINKLVEFEEKKLQHQKCAKEIRMQPFACNANEKGYVKSLTLNFDNLAKSIQYERELSQRLKNHGEIRRNYSLPDVLEVAKYRLDCDLRERLQRSTENYLDGYGVEGVRLYYQFEQINYYYYSNA